MTSTIDSYPESRIRKERTRRERTTKERSVAGLTGRCSLVNRARLEHTGSNAAAVSRYARSAG